MNPAERLNELAKLMDDHDAQLQSIMARTENQAARAQLAELHSRFAAGKTQFVAEYQKALAAANQRLADAKQRADQVKQEVSAARARLAAPPPPKPPPPPPPPLDPALGQKLSAELLAWHGVAAPGSLDPKRTGDIWQALKDWKEG